MIEWLPCKSFVLESLIAKRRSVSKPTTLFAGFTQKSHEFSLFHSSLVYRVKVSPLNVCTCVCRHYTLDVCEHATVVRGWYFGIWEIGIVLFYVFVNDFVPNSMQAG